MFPAVNWSAAMTTFDVWYSIPGVLGSSSRRIAEWIPDVVGLIVTSSVAGAFFAERDRRAAVLNVPSLPSQRQVVRDRRRPPAPDVRVNVYCRV